MKPRPVGRPPNLTPCPYCHQKFGTRDFRKHIGNCTKKPKAKGLKLTEDETDHLLIQRSLKRAKGRSVPWETVKKRLGLGNVTR